MSVPQFSTDKDRFVLALQEGLIALVPFVILWSILTLLSQGALYFGWEQYRIYSVITVLSKGLNRFISIAAILSLTYRFALRYDVERAQAMLLAISVFLSSRVLISLASHQKSNLLSLPYNIDLWQIGLSIASVFLLKALSPYLQLALQCEGTTTYSCQVLRHLYTFIASYVVLLSAWWVLYPVGGQITAAAAKLAAVLPGGLLLGLRTLAAQLLWFMGVHGAQMMNSLLGPVLRQREIFPNLSYMQFYRMFGLAGGSGMGLSLLIALYLNRRDRQGMHLARISTPFVIFNIDTLLVYCLPIVLNRFMWLPFVFGPLANITIAYGFLALFPVAFQPVSVHWMMPTFADAWIAGGGSLRPVLLQVFLVALNVAMYLPFVKKFANTRSGGYHRNRLSQNLALPESLQVHHGVVLQKVQREIIESNRRLDRIIGMLSPKTLFVYYQPKINTRSKICMGFEALLRVKLPDEPLWGPFFLPDMENAGLAPTVDLWVCNQVHKHLQEWSDPNEVPNIGINLHPDTINDSETIERIVDLLVGYPIEFEVIERSFLEGTNTVRNLEYLKQRGFRIAIDDFGQGYSSYRFLSLVEVDTVKIDKSLIASLQHPKGKLIWEHMVAFYHGLGIQVVAEGVETEEQVQILGDIGVDVMQGFVFSGAVPLEKARTYRRPSQSRRSDLGMLSHLG